MMKCCFASVVFLVAGLALAAPSVVPGSVTVAQDADAREILVSYTLADGPAIITLGLQTNGVSMGEAFVSSARGDVNKLVSGNAAHQIVVPMSDDLGTLSLVATVSAWDPTDPPDYMVADLAAAGRVWYYTSTNALPGGLFGNPAYRESRMVFRRIRAKGETFTMGSPETEIASAYRGTDGRENEHSVTLTKDYWLAVFEVTQAQYLLLQGGIATTGKARSTQKNPFLQYAEDKWTHRPAESISYNDIRKATYPNDPGDGSWLRLMRDRTGLAVDLPGEAQWEFACRAGTGAATWNNGVSWGDNSKFWSYKSYCPGCTSDTSGGSQGVNGTDPVGSSAPNAWGLYDMHGNVGEFCLDLYKTDITGISDDTPQTGEGTAFVCRGGYYKNSVAYARSASRQFSYSATQVTDAAGFRVMAPIPNPAE